MLDRIANPVSLQMASDLILYLTCKAEALLQGEYKRLHIHTPLFARPVNLIPA